MKSKMLMLMAMALSGVGMESYPSNEKKRLVNPLLHKDPHIFSKQEGIQNLIKDYKLIISGKSKKSLLKQSRIKIKINYFLEKGSLTIEDIENGI